MGLYPVTCKWYSLSPVNLIQEIYKNHKQALTKIPQNFQLSRILW